MKLVTIAAYCIGLLCLCLSAFLGFGMACGLFVTGLLLAVNALIAASELSSK